MIGNTSIVVLVGFMGAGKTTIGRMLAQSLNCKFVDLDDVIESVSGSSIPAIFAEHGESEFRRIETQALMSTLEEAGRGHMVLALGGGAYVQPQNVELLHRSPSRVVFLDAPLEELKRRCEPQGNHRPLFKDEDRFRSLSEERRPSYLRADIYIDTGNKSANTVLEELLSKLGLVR